jgi:hypothetical protein
VEQIKTKMAPRVIRSLNQLSRYVVLSSVPYQHILKNDAPVIEKLGLISQRDLDVLMSDDELRDELPNNQFNLAYLIDVPKIRGMYYGAKHGMSSLYFITKNILNNYLEDHSRRSIDMDVDAVVERYLGGDPLFLNRQPTLDQSRMLCMRAVTKKEKEKNLIEAAIKGGNLEIFKDTCIGKGVWDFDNIMITASTYGTLEMVTFCIQRGAAYYFLSLMHAIPSQNIDIIRLLFERGHYMLDKYEYQKISRNMSIYTSHHKLNTDVLYIVIEYCKVHMSKEDYVFITLNLDYTNDNRANNSWSYCADGIDIPESIKKIKNKFSLNLVLKLQIHTIDANESLRYAAYYNDTDAFKSLMEKGATDFVGALQYAILSPLYTQDVKQVIIDNCDLTIEDYIKALYFF